MDLAVLNPSFQRERLVENWNSLIWTERHSKNGDFQLISHNIAEVLTLLPLGDPLDPPTLVAINDSKVPMVVENHKIEKPKNSIPQIVTTGRSFETVLDRRVTVYKDPGATLKRLVHTVNAPNAAVAAYEVAKDFVIDGDLSALDVIPEITLINSVGSAGTAEDFPVEPKELYAWMLETLALGKYGLRAELPATVGDIFIIIYEGTDRSGEDGVVFSVALEQFEQASYLLTQTGYKNVMITSGQNGMEFASIGTEPSGLARRVGFTNLETEITVPAGADLTNLLINKGKVTLSDLLPTQLFSGGISTDIGAGYNDLYSLGDLVTLQGEYGLSQTARIAEFVRTQDTTGTKAYPTFEAIS